MPLKIRDVHNILEERAPSRLKESYDNVGLMVGDMEQEVSSVLVALDCTLEVIREAEAKGCNLIFCHHPLIFQKPSSITTDKLLGKKIIELISNGISVYSSHTNLDSVHGGLNDILMGLLGIQVTNVLEAVPGESDAGIGRIAFLDEPVTLSLLIDRVKESLGLTVVRYSGDENKVISKIAAITGSGQSFFGAAVREGADCIVTGDTTYHYVSDLREEGIAVVDAGHYGTEWPALKMFSKWLQNKIAEMGFENSVVVAESNSCPYKYR
jgi:dinuclear metal center YbgI/SA1388 family protein